MPISRLLGRLAEVASPPRRRLTAALGVCAAGLLMAVTLAAQGPASPPSTAGTGASPSTATADSPRTARSPSVAGGRDTAGHDTAGTTRTEAEPAAKEGGWSGFPKPVLLMMLVIVLLGALGALAGDLVADGTRLDRWQSDEIGWTLGFPGRLLIGVVAALIVVMGLRPPNGSWPMLISTALGAGAASEAILLAIMASWKARAAETETRRVRATAIEKIEGMRVSIHALHAAAAGQAPAGAPAAFRSVTNRPGAGLSAQIDRLAEQAKAELLSTTLHPADAASARRHTPHPTSEASMRNSSNASAFDLNPQDGTASFVENGQKEVVIFYEVPDSEFWSLAVDDVELVSGPDGGFRAMVGPGEHVIHCEAQTKPNSEYRIEITAPAEAVFKPDPPQMAAPSGIINDFFPFTING